MPTATSRPVFRRWLAIVATIALVLSSTGCAGYKLGPSNGAVAGDKSISVGWFSNQTPEPRLGDAVIGAVRQAIQRDGTFHLATREDGDIVVTGVITLYDRREISFVTTDVITPRDYSVSMTAQIKARERSTGKLLLDQPVTGRTLVRVGSDLVSSERQALPLLAEDLARNVTALLADGTW